MISRLLTIILILSSVLFSVVGYSKTMIEVCSDCSARGGTAGVAKSVFGWNGSGKVYVLDASNEKAYKYSVYVKWITEGPDRYAVHRANRLTLTPEEKEGADDIFEAIRVTRNTIKNYIENNHGARMNTDLKAYSDTPSNPINFGVINVVEPSDINAYDFLLTSKMRNEMYSRHMASGANQAYALLNSAVKTLDIKYLSLGNLGISYTVKFADGSLVEVYPDLASNTLEAVEGTARDQDGNTIPTSRSGMIGNYEVSSDNLDDFAEYLNYYNIEVDRGISCGAYSTRIATTADGSIVFILDSCIY